MFLPTSSRIFKVSIFQLRHRPFGPQNTKCLGPMVCIAGETESLIARKDYLSPKRLIAKQSEKLMLRRMVLSDWRTMSWLEKLTLFFELLNTKTRQLERRLNFKTYWTLPKANELLDINQIAGKKTYFKTYWTKSHWRCRETHVRFPSGVMLFYFHDEQEVKLNIAAAQLRMQVCIEHQH